MSNQDNINSFLDGMDFDSTPAEQAPSPQSVPFTPAAVWPGEEPTQQTAAAAPIQAEPVPAAPPTAQPAAPQEIIPTPAPAVQTPQTPQAAPAAEHQVAPQTQPIVQQHPMVQPQPVVQQPAIQPAAPEPAPVQETILNPFYLTSFGEAKGRELLFRNLKTVSSEQILSAMSDGFKKPLEGLNITEPAEMLTDYRAGIRRCDEQLRILETKRATLRETVQANNAECDRLNEQAEVTAATVHIPLCLQGQELRGAVLIRAHGGRA